MTLINKQLINFAELAPLPIVQLANFAMLPPIVLLCSQGVPFPFRVNIRASKVDSNSYGVPLNSPLRCSLTQWLVDNWEFTRVACYLAY